MASLVAEHRPQCGLSNCGIHTYLLWGLWDLPGPPGTDLYFLTCRQFLYHWATREAFYIFLCISSCFFTISFPESILLHSLNILVYLSVFAVIFFLNFIWTFRSFLLHWLSSENLATHKICIQYSFPSTCEKYCFSLYILVSCKTSVVYLILLLYWWFVILGSCIFSLLIYVLKFLYMSKYGLRHLWCFSIWSLSFSFF